MTITPTPNNTDDLPVLSTERGATFTKEDLGGGMIRLTQQMRPIAYLQDGLYRPMNTAYIDSGIVARPHIVTDAPLMVSTGDGGTRRIHPTRELDVWAEIGRPYNVATRQPYPLNAFTRSGNLLTSINTLANVFVWHGGHFSKLGIQLKGSWRTAPPAQFAFPVALSGLTWDNGVLRKNGIAVMRLTAPVVYDMDNTLDRRAMGWEFVQLDGQWYVVFTLPTNLGSSPMSRPIVDPTLTLQPDGAAGIDTFLASQAPTFDASTFANLYVGELTGQVATARSMLRFNLTDLPSGALISSATLSLYVTLDLSNNARTFRVYRSKRVWTELANWNTYDGTNNWQTAGGFGANDTEQTDIGSRAFTASEATGQFKDFVLTPTSKTGLDYGLEQGGAATGFMIKADTESEDAYEFASSDNATAANRPKFVIVYTEPSGRRGLFTIPFAAAFQGAFGA